MLSLSMVEKQILMSAF